MDPTLYAAIWSLAGQPKAWNLCTEQPPDDGSLKSKHTVDNNIYQQGIYIITFSLHDRSKSVYLYLRLYNISDVLAYGQNCSRCNAEQASL